LTDKVCRTCGKEYRAVPDAWKFCEGCGGRLVSKERMRRIEKKQDELHKEAEDLIRRNKNNV